MIANMWVKFEGRWHARHGEHGSICGADIQAERVDHFAAAMGDVKAGEGKWCERCQAFKGPGGRAIRRAVADAEKKAGRSLTDLEFQYVWARNRPKGRVVEEAKRTGGKSVRTVSGGLPGLGRRRR